MNLFFSILVTIVLVAGPGASNDKETLVHTIKMMERFREIGIRIKLVKFEETKIPFDHRPGLSAENENINNILNYYRGKKRFVLVVYPPLRTNSNLWLTGGRANSICAKKKKVAWAAVKRWHKAAEEVMAHELGHLLGARHDESNSNIMSSYSVSLGRTQELYFNKRARRQIRRCLKRNATNN